MPELVNFEDWSSTSELSDPVDLKIAHADSIREAYFKEGTYNEEIAEIVNNNLYASLGEGEGLTAEQINDILNAPPTLSLEEKAQAVSRSGVIDPLNEDGSALRAYEAFLRVKESGEATPDYLAQEDDLRGNASVIIDEYYDDAVDQLRADGASPFVRVRKPSQDGVMLGGGGEVSAVGAGLKTPEEYYLKSGPAADGLTPYEAYRKSVDAGFLSPRDIRGVQHAMSPFNDGVGTPLHKRAHYEDAIVALNSVMKQTQEDPTHAEGVQWALRRYVQQFRKGRENPERAAELRAAVVEELEHVLPESGRIPLADRLAAIEFMAGDMAMSEGVIEFDDDNSENNIRTFGYGDEVIHGDLLAKKSLFESALERFSPAEQDKLRARRRMRLNGPMFADFNEVINRTYLSSEWNEAVAQGLLDEKEEADIFDEFFETHDYSSFRNETLGSIARSIPDAATDTLAALGVAATGFDGEPNEFALSVLTKNQRDREARGRLAHMMGDNLGMVTTLSSMITPVVVDLTATALLTTTTGVGGAAYLGAKTGARLTAKGITKGIVAGALKRKSTKGAAGERIVESTAEAAERLATTNLIKTFGKKKQAFVVGKSAAGKDIVDEAAQASFERATAIDVINKYNQVAGSKLAQYPSMFVPAATRSGGMTYASVYTALPDDMSSEEKHQTALGAGLTAATITGSLVVGFRAMGMGGLEDFIVARASGSQMTAYMGKLADLRKIKSNRLSEFSALFRKGGPPSTGVLDRAMAKITAEGVKRNFLSFIPEALRRHGKNYFDEAFEEGVDEFINSYVQSGATGQDMLFADRMKHAWMASVYGGLLGMGMPAARSTLGRWARGAAVEGEYAAKREAASRIADEINRERAGVTSDMGKREIAKRLRDLDSPATADVVEALLDERDRAQIREAEDEPKRVADPTAWLRDRMSDLSTETQRVEDPTAWLRDRMSDLSTATQRVEDPTAWLRDRMSDLIPPASPLADLSVPQILDIARAVEGREGEEQVLNEKEKAAVQFKAELEKGLADRAALTSPPPEGEFDETAEAAAAAGITDPEEALALLEEDFKREKAGKHAEAFAFFGLTTEATEDEVRAARQKMVNEIFDSMAGPTTTRSQMEDIDKAHNLVEDYFAEQVLARVRGASPEEHEEAFSAALHEEGGETGGEPMSSPSAPLPLEVDPLVAIEETGVMPSLNTNQLKTLKAVLPSDLFERLVETKIPRATIPFRAMGGTPVTASEHAEIMQALLEQRDKLLADSPKGKLTLTALNRKLLTLGVVVRRSPRKGLIFGGTPIATKDVTEKSYEEWVTEAHDGIAAALTFESDVESTDTGLETAEEAAEAEEELVITEQDRQDLATKAGEVGLDSEETVQGVLDLAEDPLVEEEEELTGLVGMTERFARKLKSPADEAAERLRSGRGKLYSMVVPDLTVMVDLSTVMAYYVARWGADKVKAISDFFSHMEGIYTRKELEPHIPKIYKMAVQAVEEDLLDPELEAELDAEFGEELDAGSVAENKLRDTIRDTIHQHVRSGIPILITRKNLHGFPPETFSTPTLVRADGTRTRRWSMEAINATINTRIRRLYPVPQLSTAIKEARSVGLTEDQLRNLDGGYTNSGNYARYHHDTSLGIFNNNPANVATLLRQKMEVRIPDDYTITGKRKQYIDGKTKNINEAIITVERYDKQTGKRYHVAVDVVVPIAGDVFYKKSLVYNNPLDSDLSEYLEGVMQINRARGGWGRTYLNATLGRRTPKGAPADADTERVVLFDSARDYADDVVRPSPIAPLEDYYHKDYSNLVEGYPTTDFGKIVHRILQIGIPPKNKETATTARAMALSEIYVRVQNRTMFPEFLVTNAKVTVAKIGGETVEQVELDPAIELETLAGLIDVDEMVSFTIPKGTNPLDVGGEVNSIENKAAFLLKYGFPNKKRAPKIKNTTASRTPVKDWAEITIRHYWANEVSQHLKHTQGRLLGQTISSSPEEYDIYAVIAEAGARARARLYARRGKTDPDAMFLSHDAAKEVVDFEVAGQDLATGQDIEQESLPTAPDEALAEAGGDPWAGAGMISDESDNEVATQNVKKSVEGFLKRRNTEKKSVAKGVTRPPVAVAALKRIIVAVEGDTAPPHILEETRVAPILEHILDVARTNSNNDGVVKSYAEAVAKEELVDDWAFVDLLQTFSPMLHPRRPRLTEDLAKKVLAKLGVNYAPSIFIGKKLQFYRRKNQRMVERLGLESGDPASVVEALQKMAGASRHKSHRLVAELLLKNPELISTVKFSIYDSPDGHAGKHTRFADGTQMVSINLSGFYGQGVESVLLHEYLHAFTVDLLAKPESDLTPKQRGAKKKLTDLYKQASLMEDQTLEAAHAMESIDEFVATIFSSATFQRTVKNTNRFRQIVDAILDLFGITDASFRDAFNDLVDFVSLGNSQEQTTYLGDLDTRIERAKAHYRGRQKPDFMRSSAEARLLRSRMTEGGRRYSPFAAETGLRAGDVLSPKQQEEFDALLEKSLGHIPPSVAVTMFDTAAEAADILGDRSDEAFMAALVRKDGETVPVIYVVRENLADALFERGISIDNELHLMGIMESLITEELAHVAEFRAIPLEELDALIDTYLDIELEHFVDEYTKRADLRQSMKEGIANNDLETKRQIVGEMLQRRMKKITRGYTTQEDIDFYESNPSALRIALRYLAGVFRRLYARYNLRKDNLELAVMVNRMATEIRYLANGGAAWARRMPFDPRDPDAGFNILTRRFDGSLKDIDKDTTPEDVIARFQGMFDVLELPMGVFKKGNYQGYKGWDALKHGNTDPRITELKKKERAFLNAAEKVGNKKLAEFEKIRATVPHIEDELISEATGTHENVQVDGDYRLDLRSAYMAWRARLKSQIESGEVDKKDWPRDAIIQKFHEMVRDPMKAEYARLKEDQRKRVDTARESIREISPELADSIMEVRLLVDAFSLVMKKTYGLEGKVMAKVDSQLGIYLTRNYRIFNEEGFRERMLADETTEAYTEAYDYLRGQWINSKAKEIEQQARRLEGQTLPDGTVGVRLTKEGAVDAATEILEHKENSGDAVIHSMMSSYLRAMETRARGGAGYSLPTGVAKSMVGPLTRRRRVPPPLQKMMGVYGPEEGIQNIFRTYAIVSEMTAKQAFYNNITELGVPQSDEDSEAFVFTHEQLTARRGEINPEAYVNMRTGAHYVSGSKSIPQTELEASYDISYNMYVHEDMFNDMKQMFSPDISESNLSTSKKTLGAVGEGVRLLTGLALTMKTLGSVGFYMRNILGNLLFFGPAQGYWPQEMFKIMVDGTRRVSGTGKGAGSWFNQDSFDEYFAEVTSFNVIGTDLNASLIKDLLRKPDQISAALDELAKMNKWVDKARKGQKKLTAKAEEKILSRLKALSQAVDSFYKIGYYEMEKANILEAKRWDIENNTDSIDANAPAGYRALTDYDIKYMASTKVRRTAQSYVDALHIVEKIGKSGWTSLATPFLRFKTEVFRIAGNTWKMSKEERGSTNPVIQRRGRKRRNGIIRVIGGGSTALPLALKHVMGIGEEEEELLRGSAPEYKRFSTFFYYKWDGGLHSLDLTYVNPFAIGVDPMMRFIENASRGKFEEATEEAYGSLAQTFMEENIFLGSITDIWNNKRADTGGPVYEDGDGLKGFGKRLAYMYEQAFEPRTPGKLYRAAGKILTGGDTAPDAYRAPLRELLNEFIPAKPHKYEPEENFQRFLQRARDIRNRAATHRNILKSQGSLSEQQIRKGIREWIKVRREIDERIYSAYIGAQGLGLTQRQAKKIMSDKTLGMGKRRQGYLTKGRREREVLPPPFIRQVYALTEDEQVGRQRISVALDEISKSGTRIQALRMRE